MKLIIIKSSLHDGVSLVERGVGEKQNLPILKNIYVNAHDGKIQLTTTNLELAVTAVVPGKIIESGNTTVSCALFGNIIANLQTERVNIEQRSSTLEIQTDNYEAKLQTLPAEDFPIIPKVKDTKTFLELSGETLKLALAQVIPSAQTTEARPELSSFLLLFTVDEVKIVATDSFRLAEKTIPKSQFSTNHISTFKLIVPLKAAQELTRVLKPNETVRVFHDENQVLFSSPSFELISRLIDGTFPDYEFLIPKKNETEVVVSREEFFGALKLVGVFSARVYEVKIKTDPHKKHLEVTSADQALGENKYLLPAKVSGTPKEASFNWRYLTDGLKTIVGETVVLGLNEENKPTMIKSPTDASYFYILMPILKI